MRRKVGTVGPPDEVADRRDVGRHHDEIGPKFVNRFDQIVIKRRDRIVRRHHMGMCVFPMENRLLCRESFELGAIFCR